MEWNHDAVFVRLLILDKSREMSCHMFGICCWANEKKTLVDFLISLSIFTLQLNS